MLKILFLNVNPKRKLAIPMFIDMITENIDINKYSTDYFIQGKPLTSLSRAATVIFFIKQIFSFINYLKNNSPDVIHINPSFRINALLRDIFSYS